MSAFGGVADLVTGGISAIEQNSLNQTAQHNANNAATGANLAAYDQNFVNAAKSAGMSPLAMMGINPASGVVSSTFNMDDVGTAMGEIGGGMGQNLTRAQLALQDHASRTADLQDKLLQAQIDSTQADASAKRMMALSNMATGQGAAALGPPAPGRSNTADTVKDAAATGFYGSGLLHNILRILEGR